MAVNEERDAGVWLVGVDGSPVAHNALIWAAGAAVTQGVSVRAVGAWQYPYRGVLPITGSAIPAIDASMGAAIADELAEAARDVADATGADISVTASIGPAAQVLLDELEHADLAVVGNRGRGGFARLALGSVSLQLAAHAHRPVVVVPAGARFTGFGRVVVGVDGSDHSLEALRWVLEFAPEASELVALGVGAPSSRPHSLRGAEEGEYISAVDQAEAAAATPGRFRRVFESGEPDDRLGEAATGADLLVLGERGRRGASALVLGSVTTASLHRLVCPTVVVPLPRT